MDAVNQSSSFSDMISLVNQGIAKYVEMATNIHLASYEKIGKMTGSTNPLMYTQGGAWKTIGYDDPISSVIELATASIGYIGLEEAYVAITTKFDIEKSAHRSKNTIKHLLVDMLNKEIDKQAAKTGKLISLYGSPAESLIYRFQNINRDKFGTIKGFTDKEYMTNSFHIHVTEEVNAIDKITREAPFHTKTAGGRISVVEYPYATDDNVLIDTIQYAMKKGLYYGINVVSSNCGDCHNRGDFDICDKCGSDNVTTVVRVCGYLSFSQTKGDTRLNKGKLAETKDRVKHTYL